MAKTTKTPAPRKPRRSKKEQLLDSISAGEANLERLKERVATVEADLKSAKKELDAIESVERANAAALIAEHQAEIDRLNALIS